MHFRYCLQLVIFSLCWGALFICACEECRTSTECNTGEICRAGHCEAMGQTVMTPADTNSYTDVQIDPTSHSTTHSSDTDTASGDANTPTDSTPLNDTGTRTEADSQEIITGTDLVPSTDSESDHLSPGVPYINVGTSEFDPGEVYIMGTLEAGKAIGVVAHWSDPDSFVMGFEGSLRFNSASINNANSQLVYKLSSGGEQSLWAFAIDGHITSGDSYTGTSQYVNNLGNDTPITPAICPSNADGTLLYMFTPEGALWVAGNETLTPTEQRWCDASGTPLKYAESLAAILHAGYNDLVLGIDPWGNYALATIDSDVTSEIILLPVTTGGLANVIKAVRSTKTGFLIAVENELSLVAELIEVEENGTETIIGYYPPIESALDSKNIFPQYCKLDASGALFASGTINGANAIVRLTTDGISETVYHENDGFRIFPGVPDCLFSGS